MGKGLALSFKRAYPEMFKQYRVLCQSGQLDVGQLWIYRTADKWILNFPTKRHWRQKSRLEYIDEGLKTFVRIYDREGITTIAFPMLGCGSGELDWESKVRPLMESYLKSLPIEVYIHLYEAGNAVKSVSDDGQNSS